jgi:UDP-glucose 4-epimerase
VSAASLQGRHVFITGGLGFIGSRLVERLVAQNRVTVYDSGRRDALRFGPAAGHANLRVVRGDVLDRELLSSSVAGADVVLHLAAIAGVTSYYREPAATFRVNLLGTLNLIDALRGRPLELFLDFSTSEVFGPRAERVSEDSPTCQGSLSDRRWCYAVSKLAAEMLGRVHFWEDGLPACVVRPFNVYGPGQVGEGVVSNFAAAVARGLPLRVTGDGSQVRALCHVDDFLDGVLAILERPERSRGRTFNLGDERHPLSVLELARRMAELAAPPAPIERTEHPGQDVEVRIPDCSLARAVLGYEPKRDLESGLRETVDWFRKTRPWEAGGDP